MSVCVSAKWAIPQPINGILILIDYDALPNRTQIQFSVQDYPINPQKGFTAFHTFRKIPLGLLEI